MITVNADFKQILEDELYRQLTDGYPCNVSKDIIVKEVIEIVLFSMNKWKQENAND